MDDLFFKTIDYMIKNKIIERKNNGIDFHPLFEKILVNNIQIASIPKDAVPNAIESYCPDVEFVMSSMISFIIISMIETVDPHSANILRGDERGNHAEKYTVSELKKAEQAVQDFYNRMKMK